MKKLVITFVFISILGICKGSANNQPEQTVIATSGLNLRESPSLEAKVITSIPFLDKVALLQDSVSDREIVDIVNFNGFDHNTYTEQIAGEWVKVKYEDQEGYVFNAYLMQEYFEEPLKSEESQYALSFLGSNCVDNVHRNKNIKWKGVFKNGAGYEIKEVSLEYYMSFEDMGAWYGVTTQSNDSLLFMIGAAEDKFRTGAIEGTYFEYGVEFDYSKESSTFENLALTIGENETYLTIKEGNQQQKVDSHDGLYILWKGDLDGDGKDDYIFSMGEQSSSTNLYLSSEAEEGQLVKPVASYYSGYCC